MRGPPRLTIGMAALRKAQRKFSKSGTPLWVAKMLAPWAVGGFLLVSFTASAGPRLDSFDAPLKRLSTLNGGTVLSLPVPRSPQPPGSGSAWNGAADTMLAWISPPTLELLPQARKSAPASLLFVDHAGLLPAGQLRDAAVFSRQGWTTTSRFVPELPDASGVLPSPLAALTVANPDGATPSVPRAVSLASVTPAPVEPEIIAMPVAPVVQTATAAPKNLPLPPDRQAAINASAPKYAELIDPEDMSREQRCLAEAVYFEARSEPPAGQAAVAQVVLNRVKSGMYPDSVCGVVYQNRHRYLGCQFSFACEGKSLRVTEAAPWQQAVKVAREVTEGKTYLPAVGDATHYHAKYVKPHWSRVFNKKDTIGQHIFYRPKPGQS